MRSDLCQRGVRFLKAVAICSAEHGDVAGGAASIREMAPHAAEEDLYEDDEMAGACLPAPSEPDRTSLADALSRRVIDVEPSPNELPLSLRQNMPRMVQAVATDKYKNLVTQAPVNEETRAAHETSSRVGRKNDEGRVPLLSPSGGSLQRNRTLSFTLYPLVPWTSLRKNGPKSASILGS